MTRTATEQALHIVERGIKLAAKDNAAFTNRCIKISPKGYFFVNGQRCSQTDAVQALAHWLNEEAKEPAAIKRTGFNWDSLNSATQMLFFMLAEQIQTATQDAGFTVAARIGHDIPSISKANQPRLTNLKKAGLLQTTAGRVKSHKMLSITDAGRQVLTNAGIL